MGKGGQMDEKGADVPERIDEVFSRGDEGKEPGSYERDRPVIDEPPSQLDDEKGQEGDGEEPKEELESMP
jgi:hypothetical protein